MTGNRAPLRVEIGGSESDIREGLSGHASALLPPVYGASTESVVEHAARGVTGSEIVAVGSRNGAVCGLAALARAKLDQEIFGLGMGELRQFLASGPYEEACETYAELLSIALAEARVQGIVHVSSCVSVEDVAARHALEEAGFRLMDTRVEYVWTPALVTAQRKSYGVLVRAAAEGEEQSDPFRLMTFGASVRPFQPTDLAALQAIAADAFTRHTRTRYTVDPTLPTEATGRLYSRWIENAANGRFGDVVMVAEANGEPVGFQALKIDRELSALVGSSFGAMGIGAVMPGSRGSGVFPALMAEILSWCRERELRFARGRVLVTNFPMHRTCVAVGGSVAGAYHAFHRSERGAHGAS